MVLVGGIVYIRQIHMYMYGTSGWYSIYKTDTNVHVWY